MKRVGKYTRDHCG